MRIDMRERDGADLHRVHRRQHGVRAGADAHRAGARGLPGARPHQHLGARQDRRPAAAAGDHRARGRPVHQRWRRDHPHGHQPRPARLRRPSRPVGGDGRRPVARARRGRGGAALGDAAEQHVPPRRRRRRGGRPGRSAAATASSCCTRRPTATRRCSTTRSRSTSGAARTRRSRSASAPTCASAPTSPAPRWPRCSASCRSASPTCGSSANPTSSRTSSPAPCAASGWASRVR